MCWQQGSQSGYCFCRVINDPLIDVPVEDLKGCSLVKPNVISNDTRNHMCPVYICESYVCIPCQAVGRALLLPTRVWDRQQYMTKNNHVAILANLKCYNIAMLHMFITQFCCCIPKYTSVFVWNLHYNFELLIFDIWKFYFYVFPLKFVKFIIKLFKLIPITVSMKCL